MSREDTERAPHILIVEDHARVRSSLTAWLRETVPGVTVSAVADGEAALEAMAASPADLVLMDLGLPGISGMDATRQIHQRWPAASVVVLTIHESAEHRQQALDAGAMAFVSKRLMGSELLPTVRALVAGDGAGSLKDTGGRGVSVP